MRKTTFRPAVGAAVTVALSAVLLPVTATSASAAEPGTADSATAKSFARIADAVLAQRSEALVDAAKTRAAGSFSDGKVRIAASLKRSEDSALSSLRKRKQRLNALGEAYSAADTTTTVEKTTVKNGRATVQVTETTRFTYKKVRGDEPTTTGFTAHHELSFTGKSGKWELTGIRPTDNGPAAINEPRTAATSDTGALPTGTPASTSRWSARPQPKDLRAGGYDYAAMADYAEKYWRNYNPAYRKFNDAGGDCTNFISQALAAGGWKQEPGGAEDFRKWWYNSKGEATSWVGANEWSWYALSSKRVTSLSNVFQMDVGDIMQMDFDGDGSKDHSMMVTYRSRAGVPYLTYHSTNTYRKSVASIIASYPDAVYYAYRT
ncbi:amidase domain-containing protein [Streptomyces gamaensis]|uniref:Amidase domain-containing protein n=1 Tax=Streptomyces gamaensis TaxID=1763542 RepID=A0ABW0ZA29_9ACTN